MQNKLRQLVISALKRNEFTAPLPLSITINGLDVFVFGSVPVEDLVYEVVATVESVSPYLRVHSRMKVAKRSHAGVR